MDGKTKLILFYSIGGLLLGALIGMNKVKDAEENNEEVDFTLKDATKSGVKVLGIVQKALK